MGEENLSYRKMSRIHSIPLSTLHNNVSRSKKTPNGIICHTLKKNDDLSEREMELRLNYAKIILVIIGRTQYF